jgi:hypothetical protein
MKSSSSIAEPFLHFEDTFLYYSVPYNTSLFIACPATLSNPERSEASITLVGMGQAQYRPSCTITLKDGKSYKTNAKVETQALNDWPLFSVLKTLPQNVETIIRMPTETPFVLIPSPINIKDTLELFPDDWNDSKEQILDIGKTLLTVLIPILALLAVAMCCKNRFINWVRSMVYQGSYSLDKKVEEEEKDDFQFLSIPITPKIEPRSTQKVIEIEGTQRPNLTSNFYARAPNGDPEPPPRPPTRPPMGVPMPAPRHRANTSLEEPVPPNAYTSILKPNKTVQFQ